MQPSIDQHKQILIVEDEGIIDADIQSRLKRLETPAVYITAHADEETYTPTSRGEASAKDDFGRRTSLGTRNAEEKVDVRLLETLTHQAAACREDHKMLQNVTRSTCFLMRRPSALQAGSSPHSVPHRHFNSIPGHR